MRPDQRLVRPRLRRRPGVTAVRRDDYLAAAGDARGGAVGFRCRLLSCVAPLGLRSGRPSKCTCIVKMRVCDRAPDLFQLAQLHDVDPGDFYK
jgi:hypothetical protein